MKRKLSMIFLLVLVLSSCGPGGGFLAFFNLSSFPAHLSLTEKSVDLSRWISDSGEECRDCDYLHFLTAGANRFLFLVNQGSQLLIFDEELRGISQYYHDREYGSIGFSDGGEFYIGRFNYANNPPNFDELPGVFPFDSGFGFFDGGSCYVVVQEGDSLNLYTTCDPDPLLLGSVPIGTRRLSGFAYDPTQAPNSVFFFAELYEERNVQAVFIGSSTYTSDLGSVIDAADGMEGDWSVQKLPEAEDGRYHYTRAGFVGRWNGSLRLVGRDGRILGTIAGNDLQRLALAFDVDGGFFFAYDGDLKVLYRCRTWW